MMTMISVEECMSFICFKSLGRFYIFDTIL